MQGDGIHMGCRPKHEFEIGDFVWGKIHDQLWWPGQVYNPSDASEEVRNSKRLDHHILVAYFGDFTFDWCESSELKPFKEDFEQKFDQNGSQDFINAVKDAMHEIEICLSSDMTCYCVPPEKAVQFSISNKTSIDNYSPAAFLNHLQDVAQDVSVVNMLDIAMLRSWAASFYLRNGCFIKMIEDLFDEKQTDLNSLPENYNKDNSGREFQITGGRVGKGPLISGDEASRKKRSMAELILLPEPELVLQGVGEEDKLGTVENDTKGLVNRGLSVKQKKKKREKEKQRVPTGAKETKMLHGEENDSTRRERKKSKYLSPPYTTGYTGRSNSIRSVDSELSENDSGSSQHLHANFPTNVGACEASTKECDALICLSNYNEASAHDMLRKLLFVACDSFQLARNFPLEMAMKFFLKHRSLVYTGVLEHHSMAEKRADSGTFGNQSQHLLESNEVSHGKRRNGRKDKSNPDNALGLPENRTKVKKDQFTTETNKSYYLSGVDSSTGRSRIKGKRGADDALSDSVEKLDNIAINSLGEGKIKQKKVKTTALVNATGNEQPISSILMRKSNDGFTNGDHKTDLMDDNSGRNISKSKRTKHAVNNTENSVALLLNFTPGSSLPSKDDLISVFLKYGALIKHETELFRDPGCARVVFARARDAKKALNDIRKSKNFPFLIVDCQSFNLPRCTDGPSPSQSDSKASLLCISRDLERMIHTLSPKKGTTSHALKPEVSKVLVNDLKGLLSKVQNLIT